MKKGTIWRHKKYDIIVTIIDIDSSSNTVTLSEEGNFYKVVLDYFMYWYHPDYLYKLKERFK